MTDRLTRGQMMTVGQPLTSANGQYIFVYQGDGNLVIYSNITGKPIWDSGTVNLPIGTCGLRDDGDFSIHYFMGSVPVIPFSTHTGGAFTLMDPAGVKAGALLVVENDGNVAIYDPTNKTVWATNTVQPAPTPTITIITDVAPQTVEGIPYVPPKPPVMTPETREPLKSTVALFLPWKQEWVLKGYTRGRLLHTLTLAPQEETTIEVFAWDRHKKSLEQSTSTDVEQSFDDSTTTRDTTDVYDEMTKSNEFQVQASAGVSATYKPAMAEISAHGEFQIGSKNSLANVGKNTTTYLKESVQKASTRVKTSRTTRITESVEFGSENRVTRKIRNPNMCHTLTLDYFETLVHYDIVTTFSPDKVRLCAMIPNPLSAITFSELDIRTHETALRNALLDPALVDGFEACRTLKAWENAKTILNDQKKLLAEEADAKSKAAAEAAAKALAEAIAAGKTPKDLPPSKEELAVISLLKEIINATKKLGDSTIDNTLTKFDKPDYYGKANADDILSAKRWLYFKLLYFYYAGLVDVLTHITDASTEQARLLRGSLPDMGSVPQLNKFDSISDHDKEVYALGPVINRHQNLPGDWNWWAGTCKENGLYIPDDAGLAELLKKFASAYDEYLSNEKNKDDGNVTPEQNAINKANDAQDLANAQDKLEMKFGLDVISNAQERFEALSAHLLEHINYYKYVLFQALPPSEQLEKMMSSADLKVGTFEPRVVSMRGEYLAIPFITAMDDNLDKMLHKALDSLEGLTPTPLTPQSVTMPTQGMTIDSRLGKCSTCEDFIKDSRVIELKRLDAIAQQAKFEADRYEARLKADPKLLDNPTPPADALPIKLETAKTPV